MRCSRAGSPRERVRTTAEARVGRVLAPQLGQAAMAESTSAGARSRPARRERRNDVPLLLVEADRPLDRDGGLLRLARRARAPRRARRRRWPSARRRSIGSTSATASRASISRLVECSPLDESTRARAARHRGWASRSSTAAIARLSSANRAPRRSAPGGTRTSREHRRRPCSGSPMSPDLDEEVVARAQHVLGLGRGRRRAPRRSRRPSSRRPRCSVRPNSSMSAQRPRARAAHLADVALHGDAAAQRTCSACALSATFASLALERASAEGDALRGRRRPPRDGPKPRDQRVALQRRVADLPRRARPPARGRPRPRPHDRA